jgi:dTDP-glucose 4,6-dehydratase
MNNLEIARLLIKILNKNEDLIEFVSDRKGHDFRYSVDYMKIQRECGYLPGKKFEVEMRNTVEWYEKNQLWWQALKIVK